MQKLHVDEQFVFTPQEFLKASHIRSYFSRLASAQRTLPELNDENEQENLKDLQTMEDADLMQTVCLKVRSGHRVQKETALKRHGSNPDVSESHKRPATKSILETVSQAFYRFMPSLSSRTVHGGPQQPPAPRPGLFRPLLGTNTV